MTQEFTEGEILAANVIAHWMRRDSYNTIDLLLNYASEGSALAMESPCLLCGTKPGNKRWWTFPNNTTMHVLCVKAFISRPEIQAHLNFIL